MGSSTSTNYTTNTTSNIGAAQQPYYNRLMQGAQGLLTAQTPMYDRDRLEGFTTQQRNVQNQVARMQTPGQFGTASTLATAAGIGALNASQYNPNQFNAQQIGQPNLQQYSMQGPASVQAQQYGTPQMGAAQTGFQSNLTNYQMQQPGNVQGNTVQSQNMQAAQSGYQPNLTNYQMQQPGNVQGTNVQSQDMQAAQTGYRPDLNAFQMGNARDVAGQTTEAPTMQAAQTGYKPDLNYFQMEGPGSFGSTQAQQFMSPYMQSVVDVQKNEAVRDAQKGQLAQNLGAVRQGTYGGARQLLAQTENQRNLNTQLGNIQAQGTQQAFQNAQQQFNTEQAAQQQAGIVGPDSQI